MKQIDTLWQIIRPYAIVSRIGALAIASLVYIHLHQSLKTLWKPMRTPIQLQPKKSSLT
ncbi:MAG: hypothetical protein LRZ84_13295 [Desertifilum sp.]|nr:hypothetical protein [Desertifilum sp.]NES95596.1 hypothetical protein [Desertifilum sp. SIO1I2]